MKEAELNDYGKSNKNITHVQFLDLLLMLTKNNRESESIKYKEELEKLVDNMPESVLEK